jgi:hypothetical protein
MKKVAKIVAVGMSTIALAAGVGAGISYADPDATPSATPTAGATPNPTATPAKRTDRKADTDRRHRGLLRRALHGEATLGGKQHQEVAFQRGLVQTVNETSLTIKSEDGFLATYVLIVETRIRKDGEKASVSDIKPGDRIRVLAIKDGATLTAKAVRARQA